MDSIDEGIGRERRGRDGNGWDYLSPADYGRETETETILFIQFCAILLPASIV